MNAERLHILSEKVERQGPVVYWMSRDRRVGDNWALLHTQALARLRKVPMAVVFSLAPRFLDATLRQYDFMLRGLEEVEQSLSRYNIPFFLLSGTPAKNVAAFVRQHNVGTLVTDFSPLRIHREWKDDVAKRIAIPLHEVDAHNVVPCRAASDKREYAAATFRPKIHRALGTFLDRFPALAKNGHAWKGKAEPTDWKRVRRSLKIDTTVKPVNWPVPGEKAAHKTLRRFIEQTLHRYAVGRNDPTTPVQSGLSPYLHFGQLSAQRVVLEVMDHAKPGDARDSFIEELVVRRELSDNLCFHTPAYDTVDAFPAWALASLNAHRGDERPYTYSLKQFERAITHDPLWNAAQLEMVRTGKMHGYMRMYWAKKILEWTETPEQAMAIAIHLNDKYELDGRDPNGYTGIAWSIGGVHDRAWGERPIFGKVRYMSYDGCKRKFDIDRYIENVSRIE